MKYNVVLGGGITGLYSAHILNKRFPGIPVLLVESAAEVGGLLKSVDYGEHGCFDYGVHTFYETGVEEIDSYFLNLPVDWKFLTDYKRDLGGTCWNNNLECDAPYLDMRSLSPNSVPQMRQQIDELVTVKGANDAISASDHLVAHFGQKISDEFMIKAIEARQHQPASEVHALAAKVQGLGRVVLFDHDTVLEHYKNRDFSARIAFPDQSDYPADILPAKRGYYPKKYGLQQVIDALETDLTKRGVTILTSAKLKRTKLADTRVEAITILHDDQEIEFEVNRFVCSVPIPAFLFSLDDKPTPQPYAPAHQTVICNLIIDEPPRDHGMYYLWFHGHDRVHRVSFPNNFSDEDPTKTGYRICVECVYPHGSDASDATDMVVETLRQAKIINAAQNTVFSDSFVSPGGYPNLSISNINSLAYYRDFIAAKNLSNFDNVGILSRDDMFFQFDLIKHANEVLI